MDRKYQYRESGLDNVILVGLPECVDDDGDDCITIPHINDLHKQIVRTIITRDAGMSGGELKFIRTELGLTQAELAKIVSRERLAVGRWESNEIEIDSNAETIIRLVAAERLGIALGVPVEDVSGWCVQSADVKPIVIDASDPNHYRPLRAA